MTEPGGDVGVEPQGGGAAWGTWEELLLAFAVNRYGTTAWDLIAVELQQRTCGKGVTAQNCRLKYLDIKRRFVDGDSDVEETVRLLEQLRKLRVAELRREVQQHDLSIESLELKVKMMEEERERSLRREISSSDKEKEIQEKKHGSPEMVTGKESEKDQLSAHESNSTADRTGQEHEGPASVHSKSDGELVLEDSCNGSSNSTEEPKRNPKAEPVGGSGSADVFYSQGGSGDEQETGTKENSDVQSSAGKSRKELGNDKTVVRRSNIRDDHEHEGQSREVKVTSGESLPLMELLRAIRAHKLSSVFQRQLLSQESSVYEKTILEHVDLETVEERLKQGLYSSTPAKFFRDLLLLVNNAIVFYPGDSPEVNAAMDIRVMVHKEISHRHSKSDSSTVKETPLQPSYSAPKIEESSEPFDLLKPGICRKRSSITVRASLLAEERDEKPHISFLKPGEPKITKKRSRGAPSVSSNLKPDELKTTNKRASMESGKHHGKGGSSSANHRDSKVENKMRNSSSLTSNGSLVDAMRSTPLTGSSTVSKRGEKKEQAITRRSSDTRQMKAKVASPVKRNVGRPPKRAAPTVIGKRGWERDEANSPNLQKKKRSRKM